MEASATPSTSLCTATDDEGTEATAAITIEIVAGALTTVGVPTNLRSTGQTTTSISIAWDAPEGAAAYQVLYKRNDSEQWLGPASVDAASYTREHLPAGTSYDFKVRARGDGTTHSSAWSLYSNPITDSTLADECAVQDLGALAVSSDAVARDGTWTSSCLAANRPDRYAKFFSFTLAERAHVVVELVSRTRELDPSARDTDTYLLLLEGSGTDGSVITRNDDSRDDDLGRLNSRIMRDLDAGTYTAEATTFSSETEGSFRLTVRTLPLPPPKPANLEVSVGADDGLVTLSWDASAGAATYTIDLLLLRHSVEVETSPHTFDASVFASRSGRRYAYVSACNAEGACSGRSSLVFLAPPPAPRNLRAAADGGTEVDLTWSSVSDAEEYEAEYRESSATAWSDFSTSIETTSETVDELMCGTEYEFRVRAHGDGTDRAAHWGPWSRVADAETDACTTPVNRPGAPTNVRVVPGNNRLAVLWDPPASDGGSTVTGYRVEHEAASGSSGSQTRNRRDIVDPSSLLGVDERGYVILSLMNGVEYSVSVKAANANGDGAASTAMATPQATTITVTAPDSLQLADSGEVGVRTTNTVSGADYKVRLSIDDSDKISFNGCDPQDDAEILSDPTSTAPVQACAVGTANLTALLVVQDARGNYQPLAASIRHEITVEPSSATVAINPFDGILDYEDSRPFSVSAQGMQTDSSYSLEMTTTNTALSFDENCEGINSLVPFTSDSNGFNLSRFVLKGCAAVADATLTATLTKDGVIVATASKTVGVRPPTPTGLRANGHSPTMESGAVALRWESPASDVVYKIRYTSECVSDDNTSTSECPSLHNRWGNPVTVSAGSSSASLTEMLAVNQLYRAQIRSEIGTLESDWSDPVFFFPTNSPPQGPIFTYPLFGHLPTQRYDYTICLDTLPEDEILRGKWVADIQSGVATWQQEVVWNEGSGNIIESTHVPLADCSTAKHKVKLVDGGLGNPCLSISPDTGGCLSTPTWVTPENTITTSTLYIFEDDNLNPGVPVQTTVIPCSRLSNLVAHEVGHALGIGKRPNQHPTLDGVLMKSNTPIVCKPQPYDVSAVIALYQSR